MAAPGTCSPTPVDHLGIEGPLRRSRRTRKGSAKRRPTTQPAAYYAETLPNPKLDVSSPFEEVAAIGRELGVPLIMDNTACPLLCRPFDHGAAIVVYSATKYFGGHGTSVGGLVMVDGGNFDWEAGGKSRFPDPQPPRPQLSWRRLDRGRQAARPHRLHSLRARVTLLRDVGAADEPVQRLSVYPRA